jgi:hypothetical protein
MDDSVPSGLGLPMLAEIQIINYQSSIINSFGTHVATIKSAQAVCTDLEGIWYAATGRYRWFA